MANITGWGRSTWGSGTWGESIPVEVTGVVGTTAITSVAISAGGEIGVTGVVGTSALGTESLVTNNNLSVTGQAGTSATGSVSVNAAAVTTNSLDLSKVSNKLKHRVVTSGCGQGTTFGGIMDELKSNKVNDFMIKQSTIYHLLKLLHDKNEIYRKSGAVHGCALCDNDKILDFVEDVGRHNAVDAIAGHMWLNDISGNDKLFYTTGRLTSEMVIKVAQMNIPTLLSRSGITEMGLSVARETNVTLLGRAKGKHFLVYNGKDKIEFDAIPEPRPEGAPDIWKRR